MFKCTCCLERKHGVAPKTIAPFAICTSCIKESIIPMFHDALKFEASYPVVFGPDIILNPREFKEYFDDGKQFLEQWETKLREYDTPYKERSYCAKCEKFLSVKPRDGSRFNVRCTDCAGVTCSRCGANVTAHWMSHACAPQSSSDAETPPAFEGLERGKDYQLCPNPKCGLPVELQAGCNQMTCASASCGTAFCFICGAKGEPHSGHWDYGKPCSRWNHPDAANAHYDNPDLRARLRAVLGEREEEEEELDMRIAIGAPDHEEEEDDDLVPFDLLHDAISREAYDALIENAVSMMNDVPALPDLTGMTDAQQLATEQNMTNDLESSGLGQLMLQHQHELDAMLDIAEAHAIESENEDLPLPAWVPVATDLLTALRTNLDVYVYRLRLQTSLADFEIRHDSLEAAYGPHQATLFAHFRRFYEILVPYETVAEIRMLGADGAIDGDGPEEEVVRGEVESLMEVWEARRVWERDMEMMGALRWREEGWEMWADVRGEADAAFR